MTAHAGYNKLSLISGGSIADNSAADTISVTNLAVRAAAGISLDTVATNLAFRNTTTGNVRIANTVPPDDYSRDTLDGSAGKSDRQLRRRGHDGHLRRQPGHVRHQHHDGSGTLTATTTDDNGPGIDNITVNSGVTVESTGADIEFESADDIIINATGTVKSEHWQYRLPQRLQRSPTAGRHDPQWHIVRGRVGNTQRAGDQRHGPGRGVNSVTERGDRHHNRGWPDATRPSRPRTVSAVRSERECGECGGNDCRLN